MAKGMRCHRLALATKGTAPAEELHRASTSLQTAHQAVSSASGASSLGGDVEGGAEDDDADSSDTFVR